MAYKKPPRNATIAALIGCLILCSLGTWQLYRLHWKQGILNAVAAAYQGPASAAAINPQDLPANLKGAGDLPFSFLRGTLAGQYDFSKEIRLQSRTFDGEVGVHIVTPLLLSDGSSILVLRGWAPPNYQPPTSRQAFVRASGLIRPPLAGNAFTPANQPEKNMWYGIKIDDITKAKSIANLRPYIMERETDTATVGAYPVAITSSLKFSNNHLSYALFWFSMALALAGVFWFRFMRLDS